MKRIIISNCLLGTLLLLGIMSFVITTRSELLLIVALACCIGWIACGVELGSIVRLFVIIVMLGGILVHESTKPKESGAIEFNNTLKIPLDSLSVGDFVKINGGWYPVKKIEDKKIWVDGAEFDTLSSFNIEGIEGLRKRGSSAWDSLATDYLKTRWSRLF